MYSLSDGRLEQPSIVSVDKDKTLVKIENLFKYRSYNVSVRAYTTPGNGSLSESRVVTTAEDGEQTGLT